VSRSIAVLSAFASLGTARELSNVLEALLVHLAPETTAFVDLPEAVMRQFAFAVGTRSSERECLLRALIATNWNKTRAVSQLDISRMTLYRTMHQHSVTSSR
jgi:transcriptional regulator of acetoin/glycerol metabolism